MEKRIQRPVRPGPSLIANYQLIPGVPDEMIDPAGNILITLA